MAKRSVLWGAFAVAATAVPAVLTMITTPRVSADYRAFFIDRTTQCWPRNTTGSIELGKEISFRRDDEDSGAGRVLECGWNRPLDSGTWSNGPESRLKFQLPANGARLEMTLRPFVTEQHPQQRLEVWAGAAQLAHLVLTQDSPPQQRVDIPGSAVENGEVVLSLRFPDAASPREQGLGSDRRDYAVQLEALTLHPGE